MSTGLQVSGVFENVISHEGQPIYFQTIGPTSLATRDRELIGHGTHYHASGFGSPVGKLKGINIPIENMSPRDLEAYQIYEGKQTTLEFEGGVLVQGEVITGTRDLKGRIVLVSFKNCTVTFENQVLFKPEWGIYDMAVGKEVISTYAGPADINSFEDLGKVSETKTHKIVYSEAEKNLYKLYEKVRGFREDNTIIENQLLEVFLMLQDTYKNDWLLTLELYELAFQKDFSVQKVFFYVGFG